MVDLPIDYSMTSVVDANLSIFSAMYQLKPMNPQVISWQKIGNTAFNFVYLRQCFSTFLQSRNPKLPPPLTIVDK